MARKKKSPEKWQREQRKGREAAISSSVAIRKEITGGHSDQRGTSPGAMGAVKMQSEEASRSVCPECGFSGGRHMSKCPRKEQS